MKLYNFLNKCVHLMYNLAVIVQLGEEHDRTKESSECLKHLTQQAVTFQKKMNEIVKGEKVTSLAPLQVVSYRQLSCRGDLSQALSTLGLIIWMV